MSVLRKGEIRGIVAGAERRRRKLRLYFSLDGLTPGAKYRVVVSRRRCSRSSGTPLAIMEDVTEVVLNFGSRLVKRTGSLRKARSIRIGGVCRPFLGGSQDGTGI